MLLVDFADISDPYSWRVVDDGVMGGLSQGNFAFTEDETAVFASAKKLYEASILNSKKKLC